MRSFTAPTFRPDEQTKSDRTRRRPARRPSLYIESLEDRLMLANGGGFPDVISVGRTLSAWSAADVQGGELTITYSVYNQRLDAVSGVLLATTLEPGVTFVGATVPPDRNGQELAWSLGTIEAFGRAGVEVTVALANAATLQIDGGACAFGTVNARAESDCANPARLRAEAIEPELLRSTPDANAADPFVHAKAAELNQDAAEIFAFLRDEVGYESYVGSLRGARGTLWSNAGNALDEASLMVAMLRSSGIPARYVEGTLPNNFAQELILSMFPPSIQTIGIVPAGADVADPANDPKLLAETRQHFWVQFDATDGDGAVFTNADPTFAGATLGQTFATAVGTFTEVPDNLRHKTTVRLNRELTIPGLFGSFQDTASVLTETFSTADLVGKPLSIGQFVHTTSLGIVITAITNTYSPFVAVSDNAFDASHDEVIRGTDFQEILTNFPFGSQVLTGLFLEIDLRSPDGTVETSSKTLFDRIGAAARQGSVSPQIIVDAGASASLSPLDIVTISILPGGRAPSSAFAPGIAGDAVADLESFAARFDAASLDEQNTAAGLAISVVQGFLIAAQRSRLAVYEARITHALQSLDKLTLVRSYLNKPRISLATTRLEVTDADTARLRFALDLLKSSFQTVVAPGQVLSARIAHEVNRGLIENVTEAAVLSPPDGNATSPVFFTNNTAAIFQVAQTQGIGLVTLTADQFTAVDPMPFSAEVKARLSSALAAGKLIVIPDRSVLINGQQLVGWYEIDLATGETVGVLEDGSHGAAELAAEYAFKLREINDPAVHFTLGFIAGFLRAGLVKTFVLIAVSLNLPEILGVGANLKSLYNAANLVYQRLIQGFDATTLLVLQRNPVFFAGFQAGTFAAILATADPAVPSLLADPVPELNHRSNIATQEADFAANTTAGMVAGSVQTEHVTFVGQLNATWTSATTTGFVIHSLDAAGADVFNQSGMLVGSGVVSVVANDLAVSIDGTVSYVVNGNGSLSFYSDATTRSGVSGEWTDYTASLICCATVTLATDALVLNGAQLPAGSYRIVTDSVADSVTLTGRGPSTAPNFLSSLNINVANGSVQIGPGSGNLTVGGAATDRSSSLALGGFNGTATIAADTGSDTVTLAGTASHVLSVAGNPAAIVTEQNSRPTFQFVVATSFADTYTLSAAAPPGWTVTIDDMGLATITPPPGLQGGTFPIRLTARSTTRPELVASSEVMVTVNPTTAAIRLAVDPDPQFFVPFFGAQVPTAFRATMHNDGPAADTFAITFPLVPAGFQIQSSTTMLMIPAGETAVVGVYLIPNGPLPAPGTPASFEVVATSTTNGAITDSETESFIVPEIHGVTIAADPPELSTTPGAAQQTAIVLQSVGNVPENVTFTKNLSDGLMLDGLAPQSLAVGELKVFFVTLTPDPATPLNSTVTAEIAASFGAPESVSVSIPIDVVVPGARSISVAATEARRIGNVDLANRLDDLSIALTNLVQDCSSEVFTSQAIAALDAIIGLLGVDPILVTFVTPLTAARGQLAAATTEQDCLDAVNNLGQTLDGFGDTVFAISEHNVEAFLLPNSQVAQPQVPTQFELRIHNISASVVSTTYTVAVGSLPPGVTAMLSQNSVTLARDEFASVFVTITQTSPTELLAFEFTVTVAADGFPAVARTVRGTLTARNEFVSVVSVTATPPFTDAGGNVELAARVLNVVNREQQARASFIVRDPTGVQVGPASSPVDIMLTVQASLVTVMLGSIDTTGFANGNYSIEVTLTDMLGHPIPGGTGTGNFLVGSPVTASLDVSPDVLPPGTSTVMNTLQIDSNVNVGDPLTVVGHVPIDSFKEFFDANTNDVLQGLALNLDDDRLYVFGDHGLHVINVADQTQPIYVRNTAEPGFTNGVVLGDAMIVVGPGPITNIAVNARGMLDYIDLGGVFGTADNPGRIQGLTFPYQFAGGMVPLGDHLFVPTLQVRFDQATKDIFSQNGTLLSFSFDFGRLFTTGIFNLEDELLNSNGTTSDATPFENGGNFNMFQTALADPQTLLVGSTTATGTDTQTGVGRILVVDISEPDNINSDPPNPSKIVATLDIPGTVQVHGLALDGNLAFVVATQGGWRDPFVDLSDIGPTGNLVLATIDITDPRSPQLIHSEVIPRSARGGGDNLIALGNHRFAFSSLGQFDPPDTPQLFVVDASNPNDIAISDRLDVPGHIRGLQTDGTFLYATGDDGLTIYQLGGVGDIPVTASVQVPNGTGVDVVSGSFNVPPTQIIAGPNFDTLQWELTLTAQSPNATFAWQTTVTNLQPGEARDVTLDTTIDFTSQGTAGQIKLPPHNVVADQVLALDPASQTVRPGEAAMYKVTIANPAQVGVTYDLSIGGVPPEWFTFPAQVTVPAGDSVDLDLTLTSDPFAPAATFGFVVTASVGPVSGSVEGMLNLVGDPLLRDAEPDSHGVVITVSPTEATAGQGTAATFVARVTNTGSVTETFDLAASLPAGFTAMFEEMSITLAPGAGNFRDVSFTVVAPLGTPPGGYDFSVTAASTLQDGTSDIANSRVVIVGAGVDVSLSPSSAAPGGTLQLRVTNTGQATDTFDLALAGPAALAANLQSTFVTLAPNATQVIPILVSSTEYDFAIPGDLQLTTTATSRTSPPVQDTAAATVTIAPAVGLDAEFTPDMVELPQPGATTFLLMVENTGNTEDVYTATIMATSGPVIASLLGLDGQPTQRIPIFRLPGLATGAILLNADLTAFGQGDVTVQIISQAHAVVVASATATVMSELEVDPCDAAPAERVAVNAGNVTARVANGRLTIMGDKLLNNIRIAAGAEANSFCIIGTDGTTVNGDSDPALISGVTGAVMITMSGASDTVFFDGSTRPITLPGDLTIRMNSTRDTLRLDHVTVAGRTRIRTGRGRDLVELVDTVLTGKSSIVTGRGDDTLRVHDSQFLSDILLDGYTGTDSLDAGILGRPNSNGNLFARRLQIEFETLLS